MPGSDKRAGRLVLFGASVLSMVLGSVHAFSVFLTPLEVGFQTSRAAVSLTYSLALASLTVAVLFGHRVFGMRSAPFLVRAVTALAVAGALIAAAAPTLAVVWIGYGVMFGVANGLGYGFALQIAAQANPGREGVAMGVVTAAYALGAAISPPLFSAALGVGGFQAAMAGLAAVMMIAGAVSADLMRRGGARYQGRTAGAKRVSPPLAIALLWVGYGAGAAGGLMVIGHAAGILRVAQGDEGGMAVWIAPVVIAVCNLTGSLLVGRLMDAAPPMGPLVALPLASAAALFTFAAAPDGPALILLGCVGFAYGGLISAYPAAISKMFGAWEGPRIYGLIFTAWGGAGLAGPGVAAMIYDATGGYAAALAAAGVLGVVSAVTAAAYHVLRRTA